MVWEILENYLAPFVWRRGLGSDEPFRVGWLVVVRGSRFVVRGSRLEVPGSRFWVRGSTF